VHTDAAVLDRGKGVPSDRTGQGGVALAAAPVRRAVALSEEVKLRSVRIVHTESGDLVTSIEILSPHNKRGGEPTEDCRKKRNRILLSSAHLVEIDLLRGGERPGIEVREPPLEEEYIVLVNRGGRSDVRVSEIWPVPLSDPLPVIPVPLIAPDPDVPLDLGKVFKVVYETSAYERRIDYGRPVPPPRLRKAMEDWLQTSRFGASHARTALPPPPPP
jgi:hypothetical protein